MAAKPPRHPGMGAACRAKTHCPKGHPYAGANLYRWHNRRYCRTCCKARSVAQYQRLKEERHAP
jgi:hypothetical protein